MSMISAQIDELREYADRADGTFPLLASALRDAADTIWQLRDDLQRANAAVQDAEHDESMAWDMVRKAEAENAKLRELCKDMMAFVEDDDACEHCRHDAECVEAADGELVLPYESRCLMLGLFADRMRELSVEADA